MISSESNESQIKINENTKKLKGALMKLNNILSCNQELQNHQERIHRIAKTINSIEAHSNSYVSEFNLEGCEQILPFDSLYKQHINYQSEYVTVSEDKVEFIHENFSLNLEELLKFMENELLLKNASSINKEEIDISSDDEEVTSSSSQELLFIKTIKKAKDPEKEIKKKFFNIELKLRAFIKQQEKNQMLYGENFESFVNQIKLQTPQIKNLEIKPNPSFIKNFFNESVKDMDEIRKKRISMIDNSLKTILGRVDNEKIIKSEKTKNFTKIIDKKVSDFNIIQETVETETGDKYGANTIRKSMQRGSIFRSPYLYEENNFYNENLNDILLSKEDVQSCTDENSGSSEYEEIEYEEEVEVDEDSIEKM